VGFYARFISRPGSDRPRPRARDGVPSGGAVPAALGRDGHEHLQSQPHHDRSAVPFLLRVTLRRLDLSAEIYHLREPQKIPQVMSPDETRRLLAVATNLKARVLLSLSYGCAACAPARWSG
jgi:hypothetical protein